MDDGFSFLKKRLIQSSHSDTELAWKRLEGQLPGAALPPVRIRWMWRTTMTALSGAVAATIAIAVLTRSPSQTTTQFAANTAKSAAELQEDPELLENLDLMLQLEEHLEDISDAQPETPTSPKNSSPGATLPSIRRTYELLA